MLISILLSLYIPLFTIIDFIPIEKQQVMSEIPKLKPSYQGYINESDQEIFWFIQLTDLLYNNPQSGINLNTFFNETYKEIDPLFVISTGDLVHGGVYPDFSHDTEHWLNYSNVLASNNLNSSVYIDLIGEHDVSNIPNKTYYLDYSMLGSEIGDTNYSFIKSFSFGDYAFICLDTTKNEPYIQFDLINYEINYYGHLYRDQLDWYEAKLEEYKDYDGIFTFGHHVNLRENAPYNYAIISETTTSGRDFVTLNNDYNVTCYISGHTRVNIIQHRLGNNFFEIETEDFDIKHAYRIIAMDNNSFSTSVEYLNTWPQGVITSPPTTAFYSDGLNLNDTKIRALVWDPLGLNSVEWCAYDASRILVTNWKPMLKVDGDSPLWQGDWNYSLNDGNLYYINVKINGSSGVTIKEIIHTFGEPSDIPPDTPPDDSPGNPFEDLLALINNLQGLKYLPIILIIAGIFVIVISLVRTIRLRAKTR